MRSKLRRFLLISLVGSSLPPVMLADSPAEQHNNAAAISAITENQQAQAWFEDGIEAMWNNQPDHSIALLKKAADLRHPTAAFLLANVDPQQYGEYFLIAAEAGNSGAFTPAGNYLATVKRDYRRAREFYLRAAQAEDPHAMCELGILYRVGEGVTPDYAESMRWYQKAAEHGLARGMLQLGTKYLQLSNDPESPDKKFAHLARACSLYAQAALFSPPETSAEVLGNTAFQRLASCPENSADKDLALGIREFLQKGDGHPIPEAIRRAAAAEPPEALYVLGLLEGSTAEAEKCFRRAAEKGHRRAKLAFANLVLSQRLPATEPAIALLDDLVRSGSDEARFLRAKLLMQQGDNDAAYLLIRESARAGEANAQTDWHDFIFQKGEKYQADSAEAQRALFQAAGNLHYPAIFPAGVIADFYLDRPRLAAIYYMYTLQHDPKSNAAIWLGDLYCQGRGVKQDVARGIKLLETVAATGHDDACFRLAVIYQEGKLCPQDLDKARNYAMCGAQRQGPNCTALLRTLPPAPNAPQP